MEITSSRRGEEPQDLPGKLPSDILISILEKLDLCDAVRAGVVSRRWLCLSKQLPRLVLDMEHFLPSDDDEFEDHDDGEDDDEEVAAPPDPAPDGYRDVYSEAGDRMVGVATALLASRPANPDVDATLAMRFYLIRHGYYMALGRLLDDAVTSGKVRAVELTLTTTLRMVVRHVVTRRRALAGRRFRALFDACPAAFGALTQLTVEKLQHGRTDLRDILATCTKLEKLTLSDCVTRPRGLWQVRHGRLTDLRIAFCNFVGVDLVWLPRLERFAFQGWLSTTKHQHQHQLVSFGHAPRLTTVTLSNTQYIGEQKLRLSQILANTAVSDLRLNFSGSNIWAKPEAARRFTDIFRNLKHIKIRNVHEECGLTWIMFLLQATPSLQDLYIKLWDHTCRARHAEKNEPLEVATGFEHLSLTRVTILGFYNNNEGKIVAFLQRLVDVAVNLEEIHMRENAACEECSSMETQQAGGSRFPRTNRDRDSLRERIVTDASRRSRMRFKICINNS